MKIPIVDADDNFLYYKDPKERDLRKEITRSSAVWLIDEKGEILVAKRSVNKRHYPNIWGTSAAGGLEGEESYEENAIRETKEELGINIDKVISGPTRREYGNHEFWAQYFFFHVSSNTKFTLQESEVDEVRWVSLKELQDWYSGYPEEFTPTFKVGLEAIEKYLNKK